MRVPASVWYRRHDDDDEAAMQGARRRAMEGTEDGAERRGRRMRGARRGDIDGLMDVRAGLAIQLLSRGNSGVWFPFRKSKTGGDEL